MRIAIQYHVRSLFRRPGATLLSVVAIGLSVTVLAVMLALAYGFEASLAETGRQDNLIVLRVGATAEGESGIGREKAQIIAGLPGVAKGEDGRPLADPELYAAVSLEKQGGGTTNIPFRGVSTRGPAVQTTATLAEGSRWFRPGTNEIVIGRALLERVKGARLGGAIPFNGKEWPVVGVIDAPRQAWQSEIWGDVEVLVAEFDRGGYNAVVIRVAEDTSAEMIDRIENDPRLQAKAMNQVAYYKKQTGMLGTFLKIVGWFLAAIMAIGSTFGATNTLLASLRGRRREIGSLLAIGFRPAAVYVGFLLEALLLGLMGGVLGALGALPFNGIATGTTNWATFTEQAFTFSITPGVILTAAIFGSIVGLVGGTVPAWRASRLPPTEALRAL